MNIFLLTSVVLIFMKIKEENGLECLHSTDSIEWRLNDFNFTALEEKLTELPEYDYNEYLSEMCRVEIYIDYQSNLILLNFGDSFLWSQINHGESRLDFFILFNSANGESQVFNVLEYACYHQDQCDLSFALNHIQWLTRANYTDMISLLKPLLFDSFNQTEFCFVDKSKIRKCSNGVCTGKYSTYHQTYLFDCDQNAEQSVEVHLTTNMIVSYEDYSNDLFVVQDQFIRYTCLFNLCNSQQLIDYLKDRIQLNYNLTLMREAMILSFKTNFDFQTSSMSQHLSTTSSTKYDKNKNKSFKLNQIGFFIENNSKKPNEVSIFSIVFPCFLIFFFSFENILNFY